MIANLADGFTKALIRSKHNQIFDNILSRGDVNYDNIIVKDNGNVSSVENNNKDIRFE